MKTPKNRRAFALVLVLIALVISSSMAVFFLTSVARERLGVNLYATGAEVHHLAGMPVSQVIGLINAATKEGTAANPVSWASQPGMIRTYDNTGAPKNVYKLYSWDNTIESGSGFDSAALNQIPAQTWRDDTAHYVDINQKVNDIYPIVDPRAEGDVDGFSVNEGNPVVGGTNKENAPMPVKWLYVLEDGKMVAPDGGSGNLANIPGATDTNPIIGRVAFWTDDETCKVNINTASEGAFWDLPKSGSYDDMQFIANPPVKGEYQRVAGHPSMTSVSTVLTEMRPDEFYEGSVGILSSYRSKLRSIYKMLPRINFSAVDGDQIGSMGGTYPVWDAGYKMNLPFDGTWTDSHKPALTVYPDSDRLFVSADELFFSPGRALNAGVPASLLQKKMFFLTSSSRAPETTVFETPRISLWPITWPFSNSAHRTRNAQYRAPVIPLSPDTSPIAQDTWMTAEESLLAFCATLNKGATTENRYFFQRQNSESPTYDWTNIKRNQELVGYIRAMMDKAEPGFGENLSLKLGPTSSDWLALNTLDVSRALVNQVTVPSASKGVVYSYTGLSVRNGKLTNGPLGTKTGSMSDVGETNAFAVSPLRVNYNSKNYTTLGAFPRLEEVVVMFYATKRKQPELRTVAEFPGTGAQADVDTKNAYAWKNLINLDPSNVEAVVLHDNGTPANPADDYRGYDNGTPGDPSDDVGARTEEIRAVMFLDFANMMPGIDYFGPTFWVKVKGGSFRVNSTSINLPKSGGTSVKVDYSIRQIAPYAVWPLFDNEDGNDPVKERPKLFNNNPPSGKEFAYWSLISDAITVNPNSTEFDFSGSDITLEIYSCYSDDTNKDPTGDANQLIDAKVISFSAWNGKLGMPVAPQWSFMSRLYTTFPPMSGTKYMRPDPGTPGNQNSAMSRAEKRNTRWAWAEFAPVVSSTPSKWTINTCPNNYGNGQPCYLKAAGVIRNYDSNINDVHDKSELSLGGSALLEVSTNLRKRVDACAQRNTQSKRGVYFHEGTDPALLVPPPNGKEWMGWTGGPDAFMGSSDGNQMTAYPLVTVYDTAISMVADPTAPQKGDPRLASYSAFAKVSSAISGKEPVLILPNTDPGGTAKYFPRPTAKQQFHHLGTPGMSAFATGYNLDPALQSGEKFANRVGEIDSHYQGNNSGADFPATMVLPDKSDWTTTPGIFREGGLVARPDQDYQWFAKDTSGNTRTPYYNNYPNYYQDKAGSGNVSEVSLFSPNRQIPSPIALLGTLPRSADNGWQTMVFNPFPADGSHPGLASSSNRAPDHLYLDYFWMPVAEPYPISDQLSTAGKINLNYQIMPFTYIQRKTALHALMKATWIFAMPNETVGFYETGGMRGKVPTIDALSLSGKTGEYRTRYKINIDETLKSFDEVFDRGDLFRSASQICTVPLVPDKSAVTKSTVSAFWELNKYTADNGREQPYDHLYSRTTTKSNTFTVHWRVQSLKKSPGTDVAVWDESRDRYVSELRGSTLIERYIDPNATNIPDYATAANPQPLTRFYKWRVISENYFQP